MEISNPIVKAILPILKSTENGIRYGAKVRFSHALVISLLYKSGPLKSKLIHVLRATRNHGGILGIYAFIYKTLCLLGLRLRGFAREKSSASKLSPSSMNLFGIEQDGYRGIKFLSGCIASYFVYSHSFPFFNKALAHQITLYCFSRVVIAAGKILLDAGLNKTDLDIDIYSCDVPVAYTQLSLEQQAKLKNKLYGKTWKWFSIFVWGLVMLIYDYKPEYLQSSLRYSMKFIYDTDSDEWHNFKDFFTSNFK